MFSLNIFGLNYDKAEQGGRAQTTTHVGIVLGANFTQEPVGIHA